MFTIEEIKKNIPIETINGNTVITVASALEWINDNTTLNYDIENVDLATLSNKVKLFIMKFNEIITSRAGVSSESIGGLSQSFDTSDKGMLIRSYANELLGNYLTCVSCVCQPVRWD